MKKFLKNLHLMWIYVGLSPVLFSLLLLYRNQQMVVLSLTILAAILYVIVALLHHYWDKTLTVEVTLEYVLTAVLAIVILQSLVL